MKLTPEIAQALSNLRGNRDFSVVLQWIKEHETKQSQTCVDADGLVLYRAQGAAKVLQTIEKAYADAPETLKKFK